MLKKITGAEFPLAKIFSSEFDYHIPAYQRPYAWTEEESGTLFDDLYDFFRTEDDDNYFLGSIVLIKEDNNPHSDVIDGQQRLTTLTILLAALASHFDGEVKDAFRGHLRSTFKTSSCKNCWKLTLLLWKMKHRRIFKLIRGCYSNVLRKTSMVILNH
jgi:hypothetical protein